MQILSPKDREVAPTNAGAETSLVNLALDKPATQSSTSEWSRSNIPEEDARGGNNGHISSELGFHTATEDSPWWQVDLLDEYAIRKIVIYNRRIEAKRLKRFTILKSLDGSNWTILIRKVDNSVFGETDSLPFVAELDEPQLARFIRIRLDGFYCLHFNECQVFGSLPDPAFRRQLIDRDACREQQAVVMPVGRAVTFPAWKASISLMTPINIIKKS